ncbi:IclR family transcriptional regulator [Segetibacter sp. 3557_3]|uniref:IclR family transcriptional regulator n=1 Tax=Segetibacter sp. 3557_3 TaxID=2547429 RepID=UPI0010589AD5|nr:IclR family transcriptional regulator [Segetibacter sp. 3557_3]TDH28734.1 IclR family transcriptional regulator [Segetibacter sp. 3557_3]
MIQVIERALDILEFVAQHGKEPVQLIKIAENAGLSQPTTANIVKTLVNRNYLEHVGRKEGYRLGANAYQLTGNLAYSQNLILAAKDLMEDLTESLNETCLLAVIRNNKRFVVHTVQSNQDLQVRTRIEAPIYQTASGRLLLAYQSQKDLDRFIQVVGIPDAQQWPGVQTREKLEKALQKIREDQFSHTVNANHILGFAVPIYKNKQVVASLSVYLPESRLTPAHKANITKLMLRTANKIKERLNKENG